MDNKEFYSSIAGQIVKREGILVRLRASVGNEIKSTEWYQYQPVKFDLVKDFDNVKKVCSDDLFCLLDAFNWSVMNKTEWSASLYKYITHRVSVMKEGFAKEAEHLSKVDIIGNFIDSL